MSAPRVTVLIDTYNYGQYIEEAVESALAQEFPREQREILVVDDGSTDDTAERLKKYGDAIRYLRKPNGGQASAFNFGFAEAHGDIIATLDADDLWLPQKLQRVCETFEKHPDAGMVYHRTHMWRGGEVHVDSHFSEVSGRVPESCVSLLRYSMVATSCLAFRRSALNKLLPVPEALRSQADAYLTALIIFVAPVTALPEFLAKYRLHAANLFHIGEDKPAGDRIKHRLAMRAVLSSEIRVWLERHGYDLASPDLQALEYPRVYGKIMSPRHRLYSYIRAFGALLLGYDRLYLLDDLRKAYKSILGNPTRESATSEDKTKATGKK